MVDWTLGAVIVAQARIYANSGHNGRGHTPQLGFVACQIVVYFSQMNLLLTECGK